MPCPRCSGSGRSTGSLRGQGGAALVVAMLVFALSTALVVAMKSEFNRFYQRSANVLQAEQAQSYLRGAEELAMAVLIQDYEADMESESPRDDLSENWAQDDPPPTYALDDIGWMSGVVRDLQGRFNLNLLANSPERGPGKPRFTAAQEQFIRLLQALGEPAVSRYEAIQITEAVSDWLDPDFAPHEEGAEDDFYYSRQPAHRTGNRPMASVSELRSVAYMTPEIFAAVQPYLTVGPQEPLASGLNIHTAPAVVLRSINEDKDLSPLTEGEGESLVLYREETGFENVEDFLSNPVFDGKDKDKMTAVAALLGESSSYFLVLAEAEVADRNMRLYSVLKRGNRRVEAVVRATGSL